MKHSELLTSLYLSQTLRDSYLDKFPNDYQSVIFDNAYANSLQQDINTLIEAVFGDNAPAAFWFLEEWSPGMEVYYKDVTPHPIKINSLQEYINYLKTYEGWE